MNRDDDKTTKDDAFEFEALTLGELSDEPVEYRIPGLLTMRGNLLISAYRKTGKSTLVMHLIKCLTTGSPLLGSIPCTPVKGTIVYVNFEMGQPSVRSYGVKQGNELDDKRVRVMSYQGETSRFPLGDDDWRRAYGKFLYGLDADVIIVDPLSVMLTAAYADANTEDARRALEMMGEVAHRAEARHLIVVDHTGHAEKTRSRGASGKEDWADALWNITGENDQPRTIRANGRDEVNRTVSYTKDGDRLVLSGAKPEPADGERFRSEGITPADAKVISHIVRKPGQLGSQIAAALGQNLSNTGKQLDRLEQAQHVRSEPGAKKGSKRWFPVGAESV